MRVGIDVRQVHYRQAGITQYTLRLLQALAAINSTDEFILFQHRAQHNRLVKAPNFRRVGLWTPSHHRLEQYLLGLELYPYNLDVLHSPDFIPPFYKKVPTVITIHDLAFLHWPHFMTKQSARYYGQIDRAVVHADHIITVSESTRRDTVRLLGVPESKISVIYEAADPMFQPVDEEDAAEYVRKRFGLMAGYILFVSTIEPKKNLSGLLHAYQHLREKYKVDVELVIVGQPGWLYEEVFALVDQLSLSNYTRFLGRVEYHDLLYLYNAAACLAHPALYEGFGLSPLEALACGIPVVVSNVSSLPEVVGDAALLVDPEAWEDLAVAIHRLLSDEALRAELITKGLQRAACFSWEYTASQTLAIYRQLADHQGE